ncbi:hypothetical protein [Nocardia sp. NPDC020380]|uniref:hypothetical protein n=1 Tax=Nocardia sp. NPDC020380 TaxID=3364309 RepID=UPI0037A7948C
MSEISGGPVPVGSLVVELRDIHGWLVAELDNVLTRRTRYGARGSSRRRGPAATPLPYDPTAGDIATDLHGTLRAWTVHVCTQRDVPWPGELRADGYARWLERHLADLACCPDADEAVDEIRDAHGRAFRAVDRPRALAYQGPCPRCGGDLRAAREDLRITCRGCGTVTVKADNDARIQAELETRDYTAGQLAHIVRDRLGLTVKPKTIHDMAYRKTDPIPVRGRTRDRQNLYNAGDVLHDLRKRHGKMGVAHRKNVG